MGKFDNIVIASDMDGTFLGNDSRIIFENVSAIEYFNKNGGRFTFNTGRGYTTVALRFPEIMHLVTAPLGIHNGSCIYDAKNDLPLDTIFINKNAVCDISRYIMSFSGSVTFTLRTIHEFYAVERFEKGNFEYFKTTYPEFSHVIKHEQIGTLDVQKIFFVGPQSIIDSMRDHIQNVYGEYVQCTTGGEGYIEVDPAGATKARPIEYIKKSFPQSKIFAIGDYENDLEMLEAADYAVCPENAMDKVKQASDFMVCCNNEGAVAHLINIIEEKYLG
ncbi:MAG: HAD-IIB family hydrolase [Ruminococcaceae bacterium]|nr:HAD-IIB family hydrolase [Oscillospiraceae bacterium]